MTKGELDQMAPEHDRESCSDAEPINPGVDLRYGHVWCRRCEGLWRIKAHAALTAQPAAPAVAELQAEIDRLNAIINTPHADEFVKAVSIEAEHQRQRWGAEGDAGKTPADWFWLVGYLAGKALHAHAAGNTEKAEHHIITTAAACANWHRAVFGKTNMWPGQEEGIDQ